MTGLVGAASAQQSPDISLDTTPNTTSNSDLNEISQLKSYSDLNRIPQLKSYGDLNEKPNSGSDAYRNKISKLKSHGDLDEVPDSSSNVDRNQTLDPADHDEFEPNNEFTTAASITEGTYSDLHTAGNEADYYAVTLDQGDSIETSIDFDHDVGDLDLLLYGPDQTPLDASISITDGELVSATDVSESGTYYIHAYVFDLASVSYDMDVAVDSSDGGDGDDGSDGGDGDDGSDGGNDGGNDEYEPNNVPETAASITEGTYSNLQIVDGERDFYAITLDEGASIETSISFDHATGDLDLGLFGPDGELLDSSISVTDDEYVSYSGVDESGTYYILTEGFGSASAPYDMNVAVDGSGNQGTPAAAIDVRTAPDAVSGGESFNMTFAVTNTGDGDASSGGIQFETPAGVTGPNVFFTGGIESGAQKTETVSFETDTSMSVGVYTVTAEAVVGESSDSTTVPVEIIDNELSRFDLSDTGTITNEDVLATIQANNNGTNIGGEPVTFQDVIDVIRAHNLETPV